MHAYYYTEVERPFGKVEEVVLRLMHRFGDWSMDAYRNGEDLRVKMGLGGSPPRVAKTITMTPGAPDRRPGNTRIPVRWEATDSALFPTMDADLSIVALGDDRTKLVLQGNYQPPLGAVGATLDRFLLHHLAESSVKHFVDRVADAVSAVVAAGAK
jgi:hypothetical protein